MQEFIISLAKLDPFWLYCSILFVAYIENLFPPSPSDAMIIFGGALAAMGTANEYLVLLSCAIGSTLGFMTMYSFGRWFGREKVEAGKIKFISLDTVHRLEAWFARYGYWVIIVNRFLAGTRAVVSLFAGMAELDLFTTTILSFVSSLAWYGLLVYAGYSLGDHWQSVGLYLLTYSKIATGVVWTILIAIFIRSYIKLNRSK